MSDRREADEADAIREILGKLGGNGKGQSGLAHAARSGQGQQPDLRLAREPIERRDLLLTANKRREREREQRWMGSACRIDHGRPDRSDDTSVAMITARARTVNDRQEQDRLGEPDRDGRW
jgi:hypothetical protein